MNNYINPTLEFYEVLNAFPILTDILQKLQFNLSSVKEGESVHDFFEKNKLSNDEIERIIKKMNWEVQSFIKN